MSTQLRRRIATSNPVAIAALDRLFFVVERMDMMADAPVDGFVRVTAAMWRDQIRPDVRLVRSALNESVARPGEERPTIECTCEVKDHWSGLHWKDCPKVADR